jgi:hypothetical protein
MDFDELGIPQHKYAKQIDYIVSNAKRIERAAQDLEIRARGMSEKADPHLVNALSELSDVAAKVAIDTSMFAIDTDYSDF